MNQKLGRPSVPVRWLASWIRLVPPLAVMVLATSAFAQEEDSPAEDPGALTLAGAPSNGHLPWTEGF
jgi:hypothetical protein